MLTPQRFARRFLLLDKIATGGMAEVFKAKSYGVEGFEKLVVIKRILPHLSSNARFVAMFINEAKIAVSLSHSNIVQVFNLGKHGEDYYICMEYIHGRDLTQVLKVLKGQGRSLDLPLALFIAAEIAQGLDYAHRRTDDRGNSLQLVHRDVSPHNIVISFDGDVKIVDFGIARIASQLEAEGQARRMGGKIAYMSPEQARGEPLDARSDLFSLGLVLYELLTAQRAYQGRNLAEKLELARQARLTPVRSLRPDLPEAIEPVLSRLLALDPRERTSSAADLHEDLTDLMLSVGGPVKRQGLARMMRDLFHQEIAREQERSGLKAVVGSLARLEQARPDDDEPGLTDESAFNETGTEPPDEERTSPSLETEDTVPPVALPLVEARGNLKRNVVVLMAEPIGLVELAARLPDDAYLQMLSRLVERMRDVVSKHGGILDSFVHDRLCVLWGIQRAQEDDPDRAVACALALREAVHLLARRQQVAIRLSATVHQGMAIVGFHDGRFRHTALGDTFKLPSRMLHETLPGDVQVSASIRDRVASLFRIEDAGEVRTVWGRKTAPVFRVLGDNNTSERPKPPESRSPARRDRWFPRHDELERMAQVLSAVDQQQGMIVGLSGEAGVGKTRLVAEIKRLIQGRNVGWQLGQGQLRKRETPLAVFRDMIAFGCRIRPEDTRAVVQEKLRILSELGLQPVDIRFLGALFDAGASPSSSDLELREAVEGVFRAARRLVKGMCADRPVICVFENVQWLDALTWRLLQELAELTTEQPILLLLTYRQGFHPPLAARPGYREIVLEHLSRERTGEMVQALLELQQVPSALVDELYRRSDGNPLYLEQLIKYLLERGHLVLERGEIRKLSLHAASLVPPTLQGLIESRVDALTDPGREVLQILAVVGRQAPVEVIHSVLPREFGVDSALRELIDRDLISLRDSRAVFRNHLTWECAYNGIVQTSLRALHRRVGQALEAIYEAELSRRAEELYHHFEVAGESFKAAHYVTMAGDRYRSEEFNSSAVTFYLKALDLLKTAREGEVEEAEILWESAQLYLKTGHLQLLIGERANAERTLDLGLVLAGELEDDELEARFLLELGPLRAEKGDHFMARSYLEHALELCEELDLGGLCCQVLDALGSLYMDVDELTHAIEAIERGLSLAEELERPLELARLLRGKGVYLLHVAEYEKALEVLSHALKLSEASGDRLLSGRILTNLGNIYNVLSRHDNAMACYRQAEEIFQALGFMRGVIINTHNIGDLYFRQQRLGPAQSAFQDSLDLAREYRWSLGEACNMVYLGYLEAETGHSDEGLKQLAEGRELASKVGHREFVATGHWLEGLYLTSREPERAREVLEVAHEQARTLGIRRLEESIERALSQLPASLVLQ